MERSTAVFKPKGGTLSELLVYAHVAKSQHPVDYKQWVRDVTHVAMQIYPYHPNINSRKMENVWMRNAIFYLAYWRWKRNLSLVNIGKYLAEALGRDKPYDHATVIHAHKSHRNFMRYPKANLEYVVLFTTLREHLKEMELL